MAAATLLPTGAVASAAGDPHAVSARQALKGAHLEPSIARSKVAAGEPGTARSAAFPSHGPVTVMLQLDTRAAAQAFAAAKTHGPTAAAAAARTQRAAVGQLAASVRSHLSAAATRATPLFTLRNVYAGVAVRTDASRIGALGRIPGVLAVRPMPAKHLLNASSVPLIGAPQQWSGSENTGRGVTIGIIDTGIDYTHANFGGTGSRRAYDADHRYADSPTLNVPSGDFPSDKVVGGTDFVGDAYDASSSDPATATPHPDPNPLDCNSHGSHVAGTAAGFGVTTDGRTFSGDYGSLAALSSSQYENMFRIGPGVAPQSDLYALKVFGCEGSTNVVSEALDWAADPNGDGNFNDHLDVVNMSLGSDYGVPDDPDSVASNNASLIGITVVAAAGNGGDLQDIAGSPGNASRVIGVAASQDAMTIFDAMQENTPDSQKIAGQRSVLFDWANSGPVTGDVAPVNPAWQPGDDFAAGNADGCDPFTPAQAAAVKGKIAWEEWTDDDSVRRCGSLTRGANAEAAGAIGVILTDDENTFAAGINGAEHIPTFQIRKVDSDALRPAAENGTLNVTLTYDLRNSIRTNDPNAVDQIADFSSRGIRDNNNMKPDITAPGMTIFSTAMGTGDEGMNDNGTSMATPHIAGSAALVKAAHRTWFPEQIKAALMNTANNDVWATPANDRAAGNQDREGPNRVGAGRVDVNRAANDDVLAYSFNSGGSVGVSFGTVRAKHDMTATRLVKVENDSDSDQTYDLGFSYANPGTHPAGAWYTFPDTVSVPAHTTSTVSVVLHINAANLVHSFDTARGADFSEWVTESSGWLTMSQNGNESLRLPVYSSPSPASAMSAASSSLAFPSGKTTQPLPLTGTGVSQNGYQSQVSGYVLGATSGSKPACTSTSTNLSKCVLFPSDSAADLHYVGAASDSNRLRNYKLDPTTGGTYFAVTTFGQWRTPASYAEFDVNIDTDGDGTPNAILFNTRLPGTDIFASEMVDLDGNVLDAELINRPMGDNGVPDTNPFDTNVIVLPVSTGALSKLSSNGAITYWVQSFSAETGLADQTGKVKFNFLHPTLTVVDGPRLVPSGLGSYQFFKDMPTGDGVPPLTVRRDLSSGNSRTSKLMLIHSQNQFGKRTQLISVGDATATVQR